MNAKIQAAIALLKIIIRVLEAIHTGPAQTLVNSLQQLLDDHKAQYPQFDHKVITAHNYVGQALKWISKLIPITVIK